MSQFPINTPQGLYAAVNYLASGPSGLGQNFQGYSDYNTKYLTGNFRTPFTQANTANGYIARIPCSSAVVLNGNTFQFNFASVQSTPPFSQGNPIRSENFANVTTPQVEDFWNGGWGPIGVASCSTTNVIVRTSTTYSNIANVTTGNVYYRISNTLNSTDCNARVTVQGGTDRVFISAQLSDTISYVGSGDLTYTVQVNRYVGFLNNDPTNPDYLFNFDTTLSQKVYTRTGLSGPGTLDEIETVFSTVIDQPAPNYYWYILEVEFDVTGNLQISQSALGLRSLSAQVVKQ